MVIIATKTDVLRPKLISVCNTFLFVGRLAGFYTGMASHGASVGRS